MPKPHKLHLVILLAVAVLCFGAGAQYGRYLQKSEQAAALLLAQSQEEAAPIAAPPLPQIIAAEETTEMLAVHVKGAVMQPGLYELPQGSRVEEALIAAKLMETANTDIINYAALLTDGMEVIIPHRVENEETDWQALAQNSAAITISSPANGQAAAVNSGPVNINTAGLTALQTLDGIGPAKAQAIIEYREQHGAFSRIEDIKKVSGIGNATFEKIKEHIYVE